MKSFLRFILYKSPVGKWLHAVFYYKWNKRLNRLEGMLSGEKLHTYLSEENLYQYQPEESVNFKLPLDTDSKKLPKQIDFYVDKSFTVSAGEVYTFHDAFLIGENAVGVTNDGNIILDTAMDLPNVLPKCSPRLLMKYDRLEPEIEWDCVLSLVHIFCNNHYVNYFHWLTDSLILLEGWFAYQKQFGVKPKILINANPTVYQRDYLSFIGVENEDLIFWKDYKKVNINKLIVVKSRRTGTNMDEIVSPHGLNWMRQKIVNHVNTESTNKKKRIFLNRQNTQVRRVVNFEELKPILEKFNFEIVESDGMTVAQQIALFINTEFLFGIHGAGLTNMFLAENLTVLELIGNVDQPDDFQWYCAYYSMSQALNFNYSFLVCEHIPLLPGKKTKQIYDIRIDPKKVENRLERLLNEN